MKNRLLFPLASLIIILITTLPAHAQYDPDKVNKKAANLYSKALDMSQDDVPGAIRLLRQAVQIDSTYEEAYLSLAGMYASLKDYPNAIFCSEKARAIDSNYFIDFTLP
jgi:tetratricopeptide (TPR) repeat protein